MKAWCMFDNHTFAQVEITTRAGVHLRVEELIMLKRGASFFVRDEFDATLNALDWHSHDNLHGLEDWVNRLFVEDEFHRLMVA